MRGFLLKFCFAGTVLVGGFSPSAGAQPVPSGIEWKEGKVWVFVVGLLEWEDSRMWSPFPAAKVNRRDEQLVEHFRKAGIPDERIVYLQDQQATRKRIEREFVKFLDQTDEGDLLIFYFCGHGLRHRKNGKTWFANYDAGEKPDSLWNVADIFQTIEDHFSGSAALLMADCCHSGALYDEARNRKKGEISFAVLTSSYSHNSSTGNWTFTDSVLAGLRGEARVDANGDRQIDLSEVAKYTELEMAFVEEQKSIFLPGEKLPQTMLIAGVNTDKPPHVPQRIEVEWKGKWFKALSLDARDDELLVHYLGYEDRWDEWVGPNRRRPYRPSGFKPGTLVEVQWDEDQQWYPAEVVKQWYGLHLIHYEGYDSTWDEWIRPRAIRPRAVTP